MSRLVYWPTKYYLYAIGNTAAVSLTRDLPPEEDGSILLLGCGDPRNVLYTLFCEHTNSKRRLDFTCCDFDPAILARNVILFTAVHDKVDINTIWNIFFHAYLDESTQKRLLEHCAKLVELSESLRSWNASPYGHFIRMSTEQTLKDLRRHWKLYVDFPNLPAPRADTITSAFTKSFKNSTSRENMWSTARSAGPLAAEALQVCSNQFNRWWRTGVTFSNPKDIVAAKLINPTFAYSLAGEGPDFHYATDPLMPFHLAPVFGNSKTPPTVDNVIAAAKEEFGSWCSAFQRLLLQPPELVPIVRCFTGEAMALCHTLAAFVATNTLSIGTPAAQWRTHIIVLDKQEYTVRNAPATFNVIETSNLSDHIGLLNILIVATPILIPSPHSVVYTESLLYEGVDATKEFCTRLHGDITLVGLLFGLHPVDYISGFASRSNSHEIMMELQSNTARRKKKKKDEPFISQYHQTTTWKNVALISGMDVAHTLPKFDPYQLGTFLFDMYCSLFEDEDTPTWLRKHQEKGNLAKALAYANWLDYNRETFTLFAKVVRDRLRLTPQVWSEVMARFFTLLEADKTMPMDTINRRDLWTHMYRHGVHTNFCFVTPYPKRDRFAQWDTVPGAVRIILVVPREKLDVLEGSNGTPMLQCHVGGVRTLNAFCSIHVAYGTVVSTGTRANPRVLFNEDPNGKHGNSPLVASFAMPTYLLTDIESQSALNVSLAIRTTPGTMELTKKLGSYGHIYTTEFLNENHVFVLPEQPLPQRSPTLLPPPSGPTPIGLVEDVQVHLDEEFELVTTLSRKILIQDEVLKRRFGQERATPSVSQVKPCVMRVSIDSISQDVFFPFPVIGSGHKVRLARTSLYIEVLVPVFGPYKSDGIRLSNFPIVKNDATAAWNIHRLNLPTLPTLRSRIPKPLLKAWFEPHIASMMSNREYAMRKTREDDGIMLVKDTVSNIFVGSAGTQGRAAHKVFALMDDATRNSDTVFFVSDIRFDLGSHTVVCDAYVLPLTEPLMDRVAQPFGKLHQAGIATVPIYKSEMKAWKHLLPAFAERCRTWEHTPNCEYTAQGKVPLTEEMETDPLCGCGRGKDVEGMAKNELWSPFIPHVTRIALSPLFAVTYLETVGRDPESRRCHLCRERGKPKLKVCTGCQKIRYCSPECQKKDWKAHKPKCKV